MPRHLAYYYNPKRAFMSRYNHVKPSFKCNNLCQFRKFPLLPTLKKIFGELISVATATSCLLIIQGLAILLTVELRCVGVAKFRNCFPHIAVNYG